MIREAVLYSRMFVLPGEPKRLVHIFKTIFVFKKGAPILFSFGVPIVRRLN